MQRHAVSHGIITKQQSRGIKEQVHWRERQQRQSSVTQTHSSPSIGLLFGCVEGDTALLLVTLKLAGSVSDTPSDAPLMSLGLNFFLHEGARRKFLSSSWKRSRRRGQGVNVTLIFSHSLWTKCVFACHLVHAPVCAEGQQAAVFALQRGSGLEAERMRSGGVHTVFRRTVLDILRVCVYLCVLGGDLQQQGQGVVVEGVVEGEQCPVNSALIQVGAVLFEADGLNPADEALVAPNQHI